MVLKLPGADGTIQTIQDGTTLKVAAADGTIQTLTFGTVLVPGATTFLVAAADAHPTVRGRADYLCNGANDDVEINAAIQALPGGIGRVILSEGTFDASQTIRLTDAEQLHGMGWGTILSSSITNGTAVVSMNLGTITYRGAEISELLILGNGSEGAAIHLDAAQDCLVNRIRIADCGGDGIRLSGASYRNQIITPVIRNCSLNAIYLINDGATHPSGNVLFGGHLVACTNGIEIFAGNSFNVFGTAIESCSDCGVKIGYNSAVVGHTMFISWFENNTNYGFSVGDNASLCYLVVRRSLDNGLYSNVALKAENVIFEPQKIYIGFGTEMIQFTSGGVGWGQAGAWLRWNVDASGKTDRVQWATTSITNADTPYSHGQDDKVLLCDATGGNIVVNLRASGATVSGEPTVIKKIDGSVNTVTVTPNGGETIDGNATVVLAAQWDFVSLVCTGAIWTIVSTT